MTITRTKAEVIDDIIKAFKDDEELFNACIEELDRYNGYLGDNRYYDMDELLYSGSYLSAYSLTPI